MKLTIQGYDINNVTETTKEVRELKIHELVRVIYKDGAVHLLRTGENTYQLFFAGSIIIKPEKF